MKQNTAVNRLFSLSLLYLVLLFLDSCAKIGAPTGGPKDVTPPKVVSTKPPEYATNVNPGKKIEINFDEFIQLKDINKELIISPPLNDRLTAMVKNKSVVVDFPRGADFDTTTYTLSFGNSIADNDEGNVLQNYEFVFSLKNYVDSMNVEGRVVNAFDHKPDKDRMYVMLYKDMCDSAPLIEKPSYICWTDENGNFSLHNLETGIYKIFALKDANFDMMYDQPGEEIAFSDTLIELYPDKFKTDTTGPDSTLVAGERSSDTTSIDTLNKSDSTSIDTLKKVKKKNKYTFHIDLGYFVQKQKNQYMTNNLRKRPEDLTFTFKEPLMDSFCIRPMNVTAPKDWYLFVGSKDYDTLNYWLTDTTMINRDSLEFQVTYPVWDTLGQPVSETDTLWMVYRSTEKKGGLRLRRGKEKESDNNEKKPVKKLEFTNSIKNAAAYDLNLPIVITTKTPLSDIKAKRIQLFQLQDTVETPQPFTVYRDTSSLFKVIIKYKPEEKTSYKLLIPDSTITDIYGATNDTSIIRFKTQSEEYYGTLIMNITNVKQQLILQLLDQKENIVRQQILTHDEKVRYEYLQPKQYMLKVIVDRNKNGKWDTGNYLKDLQPERVIYYKNTINVRSNWEIDENWQIDD